jgi:hypothetical protein
MPGTPGKCPSTFNYATSCRTYPLNSKPSKVHFSLREHP